MSHIQKDQKFCLDLTDYSLKYIVFIVKNEPKEINNL
jgi:hypothetical protein